MPEPSRVRRQLGAELATARSLAGMSQRQMAERIKISQSLVSRAESGTRLLDRRQVQAWLRAAAVRPEVRERVLALTEAAHVDRSWSEQLAVEGQLQDEMRDMEVESLLVRSWHPSVMPGLVQTPDYARAVIALADTTGEVDVERSLSRRVARQAILREPGRRFELLIDESVLRRAPMDGVMGPQLAQLAAVVSFEQVAVAVLPEGCMAALPWHNFVIFYPSDGGPPRVHAELIHGGQLVEAPQSVNVYKALFDRMWSAAARGDDAADLIQRAARAL